MSVVISNSALGLLKLLPEADRKSIAKTIDSLGSATKNNSVPLPYDPDLRMTRAGSYRLIYKPEKLGSSFLVLSIFRPEDSQRIEEILKDYMLKNPPPALVSLFRDGALHTIHELWVESDENIGEGRRIVGNGSAEIRGSIGGNPLKDQVEFTFVALLDPQLQVKQLDVDAS